MQSAPPPLEDGLFVGRPSTSRLQLHPRTRSRRSHSRPGTAGIPRASSVPLLSGDHVDLEVHSTPVSLATRTLINHTAVPSTAVVDRQTRTKHLHSKPTDSKPDKQSRSRPKVSASGGRRGKIAAQFNSLTSERNIVNVRESVRSGVEEEGERTGRAEEEKKAEETVCDEAALKSEAVLPAKNGLVETTVEKERERAAGCIQSWYRRHQRDRQRERLAQLKSLLREKKTELDQSRSQQLNLSLREEKEREEKKRRRQEKMAASRQAAILSLQQKREERRREGERIAKEEIALLQASGKIKRRGREKRRKREVAESEGEHLETRNTEVQRPPANTPSPTNKKSPVRGAQSEPHVNQSPVHTVPPPTVTASTTPPPIITKGTSPPPTVTASTTTTTYTDILDTLRLLEEAPLPLPGSKYKETPPTTDVGVGVARHIGPAHSSSLSESKLQSILSYLDEMEKTEEGTAAGKTATTESGQGSGVVGEELETVASDVTSTILSQRMEIDSKNKTVEMLQKALNQQRELTVYHAKEMEKEGERRLELQRQEYEGTIHRHQSFIDQLIEDKKKLGEKCEKLVKELRETSSKYQTKVKTMEETHAAELTKLKQVTAAADKLRRERWRAEESQRIKEATVRSLEPEIQRIIQKGKTDIQRLKAMHEAELLAADERAGRRFVAQMEELRAQCAAEKEQACAHERELARQRYEKLAEQEEMSSQQQRRRLFAELEEERKKVAAQWELQRQQLEHQLTDAQEAHRREVEEAQREAKSAMEEVERRHGVQLRSLEERLTAEREAWQENYTRRQETALLTREREMRESLRLERDKEIEMVISRLEEEAESSRTQNDRAADARIKRIREKCEAEVAEVERLERSTQEKLTSAKRELGEREGEVARLRSLLRQKEEEVRQVGDVAERLTRERDNVTDVVRQEFADRLVSTEEENRRLKLEMSELKARHKMELERGGREKEREMEEVHGRVRQALEKKEENLASLRSQHTAALRRAEHLEMLLERQRRELLKK